MTLTVPTILAWRFDAVDQLIMDIETAAAWLRDEAIHLDVLKRSSEDYFNNLTGDAFRRQVELDGDFHISVSDHLRSVALGLRQNFHQIRENVQKIRDVTEEIKGPRLDLFGFHVTDDGRVLSRRYEKQNLIIRKYDPEYSAIFMADVNEAGTALTLVVQEAMKEIRRINDEADIEIDRWSAPPLTLEQTIRARQVEDTLREVDRLERARDRLQDRAPNPAGEVSINPP
ncbi:hypothetical protein AB0C34_30430 [Nocardia sp. NPDC049220]|uniref:hypothetical protein n=1 Tax=Nocardia sp. NPDC049220 TaxID=3155273 RepID=UPI0033C212D5